MNLPERFVHYTPDPRQIEYNGQHQRATVVEIVNAERGILNLHIPQGSQGKDWPVSSWQVVDNVPHSATCDPGTWHEVDITEAGDYEQETCCCGPVIARMTYEAYKKQESAWIKQADDSIEDETI